mmetsp:Transcript_14775/g.21105  ORF Transcript_14775/g.21105 Transcript_14775/m.21105 type:complete len:189 (+) Transcript_14775:110-676(+)|eukprot:CAMPEP_0184857332 /NCGR_PEP_ID=MMETSP0580-20130426/2500_1 /TAXON_ID=1118495 /ORGANISM="Dactyliosolen fragilissimus" /LENGTH=188 /DNA_ID=CAMNT_0027352875 /DNA_START=73 /DNA_END=639 /DNA_ORIENTATION=-
MPILTTHKKWLFIAHTVAVIFLGNSPFAKAFSVRGAFSKPILRQCVQNNWKSLQIAPTLSDDITNSDPEPEHYERKLDKNGNEFLPGSSVKLVSSMNAFHVNPKSYGRFDPITKTFIPVAANAERKEKCLVIPEGMIGSITMVYNEHEFDANLPIKVKFSKKPEENGGYILPLSFLMHFETHEVEVVK